MVFLWILFLMPRSGYRDVSFLAVYRVDLLLSVMSASRMANGCRRVITALRSAPLTRKLRRPYSLLKVWTTIEFSPYLVVWRIMISVLFIMVFLKPCCHCAECFSSVRNFILLLLGDVSQSLSRIFISDEYRIISEAAVS